MPGASLTSFTLTSEIERGITYKFKVRAKNIHGIGLFSEITEVKAAGPPY